MTKDNIVMDRNTLILVLESARNYLEQALDNLEGWSLEDRARESVDEVDWLLDYVRSQK